MRSGGGPGGRAGGGPAGTGPGGSGPVAAGAGRRRWSRAVAGGALGLSLAVALPGTATAEGSGEGSGERRPRSTAPVGLWSGTITFAGTQVAATMSFLADGTMCASQPPGPSGGADGSGRWWRTGPSAFAFQGVERFFDGSGTTTGFLSFSHAAVLPNASEFTSTGEGTYYDADGVELGTTPATSHLTKVSAQPQPC
ncbi:hypothetical protein AB0O01_32780 [Streptomyces sp. NPDC093252]|uniref:hypothetical protein n=1 Tax=Streptomyces sp. NPDC093252 TaxID=3154980 RepID=UPI00341C18DF